METGDYICGTGIYKSMKLAKIISKTGDKVMIKILIETFFDSFVNSTFTLNIYNFNKIKFE
jgi:hypothetical protein